MTTLGILLITTAALWFAYPHITTKEHTMSQLMPAHKLLPNMTIYLEGPGTQPLHATLVAVWQDPTGDYVELELEGGWYHIVNWNDQYEVVKP